MPESERKHCGHGEGRVVTQLAEGVSQVLPQGIHQPEYGARSVGSQRKDRQERIAATNTSTFNHYPASIRSTFTGRKIS